MGASRVLPVKCLLHQYGALHRHTGLLKHLQTPRSFESRFLCSLPAPTIDPELHKDIVPRKRPGHPYTSAEDATLRAAVEKEVAESGSIVRRHGVWERVAHAVPGRSPKSVAIRWSVLRSKCTVMDAASFKGESEYSKRSWTAEENERLLSAIKNEAGGRDVNDAAREFGFWTRVAVAAGGGRTNRSCRQRYFVHLKEGRRRGRFSRDEDREILKLSAAMPGDYAGIARSLSTDRVSSAVRERIKHVLDPSIRWSRFSAQEDEILRQHMARDPSDWRAVVQALPGRTSKQCMDHWFSLMPGKSSGNWTTEEDARLREIYATLLRERGRINFTYGDVARRMGTRNRKQCYVRHRKLLAKEKRNR